MTRSLSYRLMLTMKPVLYNKRERRDGTRPSKSSRLYANWYANPEPSIYQANAKVPRFVPLHFSLCQAKPEFSTTIRHVNALVYAVCLRGHYGPQCVSDGTRVVLQFRRL